MLKISLSSLDQKFVDAVNEALNRIWVKERVRDDRKLGYLPFEGHQSRLGHYYRHLFQMVSFVDEASPDLKIDKRKYMKTIRAQLSTHEQALLLINSLTPIGQDWWVKNLIVNYGLVANIPCGFFAETIQFETGELFPAGYFEWKNKLRLALPTLARGRSDQWPIFLGVITT